jgi:[1-hydroxy-2-(trimethylamino)ethyl]phosphonate dioxygenase
VTATSIDAIRALYERWGADHYDEELSQLEHALQTAALAERAGASDELIVAALLHDVGHLLGLQAGSASTDVDRRHERVGARYLARLFGRGVTQPIALHVAAKRYLCAVDPGYAASLSEGSVRSLERQGGPMSDEERRAFEQRDGADHAVDLRRWDDLGKVDGLVVEPFDHHLDRLRRAVRPT